MNNHRKFFWGLSLSLVLTITMLALSLARTAQATNTSYYVDCSASSNGSGTEASPWNTIDSVNATTFGAGDQILFKRGTTCSGKQLHPLGSGASGSPIIIDAYGTGNKPIIAGAGVVTQAVYLYNQEYWEIRNLEVTNYSATAARRRGVYVVLQDFGIGDYYRLTGLTVHNVNGDDVKDSQGSAGIEFDVLGSTTQTKFNDVILDGNTVYTVNRSGIIFTSYWNYRTEGQDGGGAWYPATNVIIRNNLVYDTGGDGIVPHHTDGALVEYNIAHTFQARSTGYNAGIWAWNVNDILFQYNEAYNGQTTRDGMAYDIDGGNTNAIYQYNYSHDNVGGFFLICNWTGFTTSNGAIRYNISQNDRNYGFTITGSAKATNVKVYNNTMYFGYAATIIWNNNSSTGANVAWYNNIFDLPVSGSAYSSAALMTYDYNIFYGYHPSGEPSDAHKLTSDPLFVNPGSGGTGRTTVSGYQLQAGSPAISSGTLISNNGGLDYWGNAVPQSCAPDRGAHQYSSATGCPTSTPSPTTDPGYNYVQNPGFETGSLSPWGSWNNSVVASDAHTGTYSMRDGTAESSGEQTISGLTPNTAYVLKGWVKTSATSVTAMVGAKNYGGTDTAQSSTSTTYTQLTVNFTTGSSNTTATIYCYKPTTTGYVYCDDFSVTVASVATSTPTNTPVVTNTPTFTPTPTSTTDPNYNYVQNPGFETGALSPWTAWAGATIVTDVHGGSYAARCGTGECGINQIISVSPSTTYKLSGWVKLSAAGDTGVVGVKDYGGTTQDANITATTYTEGVIYFTTGSTNTTATIYCYKYPPVVSAYIYCDDFSVTVASAPTPTPTNTPTNTPTRTATPTNTATPSNSGWIVPAANAAATGGDGDGFGTNPANAYTDNATFAVDTNSGTTTSTSCSDTGKDRHVFYTYNLSSVPSGATILGLEVQLQMKVDATTGSPKSCIELSWDGGATWTAAKTSSTFTKTEASYTLGGAADTWGHTWTQAELSNLRVRITNVASNTSRDFSLDWIPVRVTYR